MEFSRLHMLAHNGGSKMEVQEAIDLRPDLINNRNGITGETPLHCVVHTSSIKNYCELINILLDNGADMEIGDNLGYTPLQTACILATKGMDLSHIRLLLERGASISRNSESRESPLHIAILNRNIKLIELLLEFGADIHEKDYKRKNALDYASGDNDILSLLENWGEMDMKEPDV